MQHTPERATQVDPEQFDNLTKRVDRLSARVDRLCARVDQLRIELSVLAGEFRTFRWFMSFALVAIMGGFAFLYQGQADLREAMHRGDDALRVELTDLRERTTRLEEGQRHLEEGQRHLEEGQRQIQERLDKLFELVTTRLAPPEAEDPAAAS